MDSKRIQEITAQGIVYKDNEDNKKFIDFTECFNTHLQWVRSSPTTTKRMIEHYHNVRQVGEINYYGDIGDMQRDLRSASPYVIFYDNQLTRFEFLSQDECGEFREKVMAVGWFLFDLSD